MIEFKKHSNIYTLEVSQKLLISIEKAWDFFSSPTNLSKITPQQMKFRITSGLNNIMYAGQIITYSIQVFPYVSMQWVTEITQVVDGVYFIDEQRFGPYSMWHHEHFFTPIEEGVLIKDKVSYKIPLAFMGSILHTLFIKKQVKKIFNYRYSCLEMLFNKPIR